MEHEATKLALKKVSEDLKAALEASIKTEEALKKSKLELEETKALFRSLSQNYDQLKFGFSALSIEFESCKQENIVEWIRFLLVCSSANSYSYSKIR